MIECDECDGFEPSAKLRVLPSHMWTEVHRYVVHHWAPEEDDFLEAVICNNLREVFRRADDKNVQLIREWVSFFYWDVPGNCWGSYDAMERWVLCIEVHGDETGYWLASDQGARLPEPWGRTYYEKSDASAAEPDALRNPEVRAFLIQEIMR